MHRRLALGATAAALVAFAFPAGANAHNVSVEPRFGELGDVFVFKGKAWQPNRRVRWYYDEHNDGTFEQSGRLFTSRRGRFRFRWFGEDTFDTHRMCFKQFDTRFGRIYFKCRRFTLVPT